MIERKPHRTYTATERAEAVALALACGSVKAGKQLGISHRTVSSWVSGEVKVPELRAVVLQTRQALAERMQEILSVAAEQVLAGLRDPKQRLGDRVRALEVALEAARILGSDSATSDPDALSDDEETQLADWLRVNERNIAAAERELAVGPGGEE
jgi:transposase-like protein